MDDEVRQLLGLARKRARNKRGAAGHGELQRVHWPIWRALGGRLSNEPDHRSRRRLAFRQTVDGVVHDHVAHVEIASSRVNEVAAANGEGITITAERQHLQCGVCHLDAGRNRHRSAVHGVETVGAREERQSARAADTADQDDILRCIALGAQRVIDGVEHAEIAAAGAPRGFDATLVVLDAVFWDQCRRRSFFKVRHGPRPPCV